ncbi:MAG TPA: DivIVA domain-containing protein [Acidimicrobiales bacterium]|nr:DivIVA domain-containing protein [Acidimicrobiales bacterium]
MASPTGAHEPFEPDVVARHEFATAFRGFDQIEVRGYLNRLAAELRDQSERERELRRRVDEAERRAGAAENIDEDRLTAMLGEETARIVAAARDAATEIRAKAEAKVAALVREARDEAARTTASAEAVLRARTAEAEAEAAGLREKAQRDRDEMIAAAEARAAALRAEAEAAAEALRAEAVRVRDEAAADAARLRDEIELEVERRRSDAEEAATAAVEAARLEGREMVAEAQAVRERILTDLARRRRAARAQLEQLRAARERLVEAYAVVRRTLDDATAELSVAVPEAKLAADAAARRVEAEAEMTVDDLEAELDAARLAGLPLGERPPSGAAGVPDDDVVDVDLLTDVGALDEGPVDGGAVGGLVADEPAADEPVDDEPADDEPVADEPVDRELVADEPVDRDPAEGTEPVDREPAEVADVEPPVRPSAVPHDDRAEPRPDSPRVFVVRSPAADEPVDPGTAEASPGVVGAGGDVDGPDAEVGSEAALVDPLVDREPDDVAREADVEPALGAEPTADGEPAPGVEQEADRGGAADVDPDLEADAEGGAADRVDDLFARLRAGADAGVEPEADVEAPDTADEPRASLAAVLAPMEPPTDAPEPLAVATAAVDTAPVDTAAVDTVDPGATEAIETVLDRRDARTEPLEQQLARSLKRALSDDENERLDALRRQRRAVVVDEVLPPRPDHEQGYRDAVDDLLGEAAAAGADLAAELMGDEPPTTPIDTSDLVAELLDAVIPPLRARVAELIEGTEGDDAVDAVRACYRQWRTGRIADLAGWFVHAALNLGVVVSVPAGTRLVWTADTSLGPCPDGEDNALAGPVTAGDEFPTGHRHPPAHPACRCLLVPDRR